MSKLELCINFAVTYSTKLAPVWSSASYTEKQRLQFLLFPEGIFYNRAEDECRTTGVNEVFSYIAELERLLKESKSRTPVKKLESAAWVAPRVETSNQIIQDLKDLCPFLGISG